MIQGWGGRLGTLQGTEEGARLLAALNDIRVDDVRILIKRLIKEGYDKKIPVRPSEQEILTAFESSLLLLVHLGNIREEIENIRQKVHEQTDFLQSVITEVSSNLQPMLHVQENTESNFLDGVEDLFATLHHQPQHETDDLDDLNQAIDSDEEAKLFEELDALMEAQERADAFKGNVHQLMAQTFQKVSRRVVELEAAYDLV